MKRCVIIGGAPINDYEHTKKYITDNDFVIVCDCGLRHIENLGVAPDLIIGDFDSHEKPELDVEIITLPREKDDTDSFFAVKEALKRNFESFLLLGVIGKRLDHTLANISILQYLDRLGKRAVCVDDYSEMEIVSKSALIGDDYKFFSLLAIDGAASGITIKNALFPLENGEITPSFQYGVSNETIKGSTASVTVENGSLLLVKIIKE